MKFILLGIIAFTINAAAYVPTTRTILNRTAKNSGTGTYAVELEVQIETKAEPIVLRERWVAKDAEKLKVSVQSVRGISPAVKFDVVYLNGRKYASYESGKSSSWNSQFLEPALFSKTGREILNSMLAAKILNANWLSQYERPSAKPNGTPKLARTGGSISYFLGERTPISSETLLPGLWIEQDSFLIRRVRYPSQDEIQLDDYQVKNGLWVAVDRQYTWGTMKAKTSLISAKSITDNNFSAPNSSGVASPLPEFIADFYTRFR